MSDRPPKKAKHSIWSFLKQSDDVPTPGSSHHSNDDVPTPTSSITPSPTPSAAMPISINYVESSFPSLEIERDPGLRKKIWEYPVNQQDEIRRAYIKVGSYQPKLAEYPKTAFGKQFRKFQYAWFQKFDWLEYSPTTDKAYCFPCFVFQSKDNQKSRSNLVHEGFNNWKKVNDKEKCVFLRHAGNSVSNHSNCVRAMHDLVNSSQNIDKLLNVQSSEDIVKNRLRLQTSIRVANQLAMQDCAFIGHGESENSSNHGNFLEFLHELATVSDDIANVVENAPKKARYTSPMNQKELLNIMANKVRQMIREEVGDGYFCILVDEARDEAKREHMTIVLRFVNNVGILVERFFDIRRLENTTADSLKNEISRSLIQYNFQLHKMRGQGYYVASNMRGAWNEFQALFLKDYPSAYNIHCFAQPLQLILVAAAKDMFSVAKFFSYLTSIMNVLTSSSKQLSELQAAQREDISSMLEIYELESGNGASHWSSHYQIVRNMVNIYATTCKILLHLAENGQPKTIQSEADGLYSVATTFDFVFHLHLMNSILGAIELLCKSLQCKDQNILTVVRLVSTTKDILNQLRQHGWDTFICEVKLFCECNHVDIPDMSQPYTVGRFRLSKQQITIEHYYHYEIFNQAIDCQMMELNNKFNESTLELLTLSEALNPNDSFRSFNIDDICKLATRFYAQDFNDEEIHALKMELMHYKFDVTKDAELRQISLLSDLSAALVRTRRTQIYQLVFRLIRLVLTLPVSTATTERAFSAMKHVKTTIRSKIEDEFLADSTTLFIERELFRKLDIDSVIYDFDCIKTRPSCV